MKIKIDPFDPASIGRAIAQLKDYQRDFEEKEREFLRRLAQIGARVAEAGFATADYDGVNDVKVSWEQSGSRARVIAAGETVGFIEFGTGIRNPEWDSSGMDYTPPAHGTYGKGKGANPNGWYFTPSPGAAGKHTYGNTPANAMLTARNEMIDRVTQIAREVWRND